MAISPYVPKSVHSCVRVTQTPWRKGELRALWRREGGIKPKPQTTHPPFLTNPARTRNHLRIPHRSEQGHATPLRSGCPPGPNIRLPHGTECARALVLSCPARLSQTSRSTLGKKTPDSAFLPKKRRMLGTGWQLGRLEKSHFPDASADPANSPWNILPLRSASRAQII